MHLRRRSSALVAALSLAAGGMSATLAATPASGAPPDLPGLAGHWTFDEGSGTTAADSAGGHDATLTGGSGWGQGIQGSSAVTTNGSNGFVDTGATVLDTTASFSVSAWVKLSRISGFQTVVSIDGGQVSNFFLQFRDDTRRFAFVRLPTDASVGAPAFPSATFDPVANQWYQLTGVYDSVADTLSLYVDGVLQATTTAPPAWAPAGHLVIGRGRFGGNPVDWVSGSIDDVRAYSGALTGPQAARLAAGGTWNLDEGGGTTAADGSLNHFDGTLSGGATWTTGAVGPHAVAFDGTSGLIDTPGSVIDTSQSFTVAAWVRLDSATGFRTAVGVDGDQVSGFYLQRRDDGRFAFTRLATDSTSAAASVAESTDTAQVGAWYHLAGVYDRVAGTITLYVNGARQRSVPFTTPWRAGGHLVIGRGLFGGPADFFSGAVDDVRAYPFGIDDAAAAALAVSGRWHFDEGGGTTAADSSPDAATGTLRGATWAPGAAGSSVLLDGTADVTMGDVPSLDLGTGSLSVATWFRTSATAPSQPVVQKGATTAAESGYRLGVDAGAVTARLGGGDTRIEVATTAHGFADGQWHHAALVVDRASARLVLYLDGLPAAIRVAPGSCGTVTGTTLDITACASASGDSTRPFTVGSTSGAAPRLSGGVDEVQVTRFALSATGVAVLAGASSLSVDGTDLRAATHASQYGAMLEDISHSVEGGVYAELVRNRSFAEAYQPGSGPGNGLVPYWELSTQGGAAGSLAIDTGVPLNSAIDQSLRVHIDSLPPGGRVAAGNIGYYGVRVDPATRYTGSLFARAGADFTGTLSVSLEKADGTMLARRVLGRPASGWKRYGYTLKTPRGISPSTDNRIVVSLANTCKGGRCPAIANRNVWLSTVSVFPPTYKNRPNGLRRDVMTKLAAMHVGLLRVPGGNYLEGNTFDTRFNWKDTIGPIWQRPGHQNTAWGYWSSDGMGLLEYLQMAQDVGAQPLLAVFAGYTLNGQHVAESDFGPIVQDALDEIQYAIGDTSTPWGARRAADGHPAPFDLHYVEIGNEDFFDRSGSYEWRFADLYDAIRARYPQLRIVATTPVTSRIPDVVDEHFYEPPSWFNDNSTHFDTADRGGPRILVGEYGAQQGSPTPTLAAAVGEAAFLTGLERNSDIVVGSMYAPMLVNENQSNWPTNLIGLDAAGSYRSPSYWVQTMFANNLGRNVVGSGLSAGSVLKDVVTATTRRGRTTFYVKVVNPSTQLQSARISFTGVGRLDRTATETVLTGDPGARNTLATPDAVAPTTNQVRVGNGQRFAFPANSVTVLRITGR
ncbi:MAG TPA: LamG-like jellyroll fold domain-containing protein [Mycobacteriales bacterium]|nr:LamG-like jellyroll fold domain-containing protein [Mycobacteriales bacterium]